MKDAREFVHFHHEGFFISILIVPFDVAVEEFISLTLMLLLMLFWP
jgi:hypothetical protein